MIVESWGDVFSTEFLNFLMKVGSDLIISYTYFAVYDVFRSSRVSRALCVLNQII